MANVDKDWMLAEFQGSYVVAHPEGFQDQKVLKQFRVQVEMNKMFLDAPGLQGAFNTYYRETVKACYPDMIDIYRGYLVQATELDGTIIQDPKALSHENLLKYIELKRYPINLAMYNPRDLRNEVVLYEKDKSGQQFLQASLEKVRGASLAISEAITKRGAAVKVLEPKAQQLTELQKAKESAELAAII